MHLFDGILKEIKACLALKSNDDNYRIYEALEDYNWPDDRGGNLVLQSDTGLELGHPEDESVSLLIWTQDVNQIKDNQITLIGSDIKEVEKFRLPFGKIVLVCVEGFTEENAYERYKEMELSRFDFALKGYMMRAAAQTMKEWSRISKDAIRNKFSFSILGSAQIESLKKLSYVSSVEIIYFTSTLKDVEQLKTVAMKADRINRAILKMSDEMSFDCDACEFNDVCSDVSELRSMRNQQV